MKMKIVKNNNNKRIGNTIYFGNIIDKIERKITTTVYSEMFALQSIVQQQGSHQQIFLPPRAPQLMQKVCHIFHICELLGNVKMFYYFTQYLQSGPPPMSATPPNKRGRSPSPTPQYYKTNNPQYPPSQSEFFFF